MEIRKSYYFSALTKYCSYRDRCHSEVRSKLLELGARGTELEEVMAALIEEKYLNEERYAQTYVRSKFNYNNWGRHKIRQELELKKISEYCIRKGMQEITDEDYSGKIKTLAVKKQKEIKEQDPWIVKNKLFRFLYQKGFEADLIQKTVEDLLQK